MSKKRFGISSQLSQGLADMINIEANNEGVYRHTVIPIARIEPDPANPRKLNISLQDIVDKLQDTDTFTGDKKEDFLKLQELAQSIKLSGLINPIVVYKHHEKYRIVAGERRFLASILAGKNDIEARIFNTKPEVFELKLVQWFENTAREDLTILERVENVRDLINAYKEKNGSAKITQSVLCKLTGISDSMAFYYLSMLNASNDVIDAVRKGIIGSLEKAALVSNIKDHALQKTAIEACANNVSVVELRKIISAGKAVLSGNIRTSNTVLRDDISLGKVKTPEIIRVIVEGVINLPTFSEHQSVFSEINWQNKQMVTSAFKKLIKIIEAEV